AIEAGALEGKSRIFTRSRLIEGQDRNDAHEIFDHEHVRRMTKSLPSDDFGITYRGKRDLPRLACSQPLAQRGISSKHRVDRAVGVDKKAGHSPCWALRRAIVLGRSSKSYRSGT